MQGKSKGMLISLLKKWHRSRKRQTNPYVLRKVVANNLLFNMVSLNYLCDSNVKIAIFVSKSWLVTSAIAFIIILARRLSSTEKNLHKLFNIPETCIKDTFILT